MRDAYSMEYPSFHLVNLLLVDYWAISQEVVVDTA